MSDDLNKININLEEELIQFNPIPGEEPPSACSICRGPHAYDKDKDWHPEDHHLDEDQDWDDEAPEPPEPPEKPDPKDPNDGPGAWTIVAIAVTIAITIGLCIAFCGKMPQPGPAPGGGGGGGGGGDGDPSTPPGDGGSGSPADPAPGNPSPGPAPGGGGTGGGGGGTGTGQPPGRCWVAREIYGIDNPNWMLFRDWMYNEGPKWLSNFYTKYGEKIANFIKNKPNLKRIIKTWMDTKI